MSYVQALLNSTTSPPNSMVSSPRTSDSASQPSSPLNPQSTTYYVSPHSPTHLRFPPSPTFSEWKRRCFRCYRKGHTKALCKNKLKCGKCWQEGHVGSHCNLQDLNQAAQPTSRIPKPKTLMEREPLFDDMLMGPYPVVPPNMPSNRTFKTPCFVQRSEDYFIEMTKLQGAVVLHTRESEIELRTDQVADYATRTGLVTKEEIFIGVITRGRYLINLPLGLAPKNFIRATLVDLWDFDYTFQPWTSLDEAAIVIPSFRVLIALEGLPIHL